MNWINIRQQIEQSVVDEHGQLCLSESFNDKSSRA